MAEATRRIEEGQYAGAEAMLTQLLSPNPAIRRSANYWPGCISLQVIWSWPWANIDFWPVRPCALGPWWRGRVVDCRLSQSGTGLRPHVGTTGRALSGEG